MRHQYRITKYDPKLRSEEGWFLGEDWTSRSDVGRVFNGVRLSDSEYLRVEEAYLFAIKALLTEAGIENLVLRNLENHGDCELPEYAKPDASLNVSQCVEVARLVLREQFWGKLVDPGRAYVHFGYDDYMYLGLPVRCPRAIADIQARGLFVEKFRSPYLPD